MTSATYERIYALVRQIPPGRVCSYGSLARALGQPHWARVVGYAMRACRDDTVPCHRVVRQDGSLAVSFGSGGPDWQRELLEAEGVEVAAGRVDMNRYAWSAGRC